MTSEPAPPDAPDAKASPSGPSALRRILPWLIAVAVLAFVLYRVDADRVIAELRAVGLPGYVAFITGWTCLNLVLDSLAAWFAYRRIAPALTLRALTVVRAATYLPSVVNYHAGQAYLTYLLARQHGVPLFRVAGTTLLVYATTTGGLVATVLLFSAWAVHDVPWLFAWLLPIAAAGLLYLAVVKLRPAFLARRETLLPLFEAGVTGHAKLLLWRLPHIASLVAGTWAAYRFFGIDPPLLTAMALMPIILLVSALPITPQGIGTRELVALQLLVAYATGDTEAGEAAVVAAGTLLAVCSIVVQAVLGLVFTPSAAAILKRR